MGSFIDYLFFGVIINVRVGISKDTSFNFFIRYELFIWFVLVIWFFFRIILYLFKLFVKVIYEDKNNLEIVERSKEIVDSYIYKLFWN